MKLRRILPSHQLFFAGALSLLVGTPLLRAQDTVSRAGIAVPLTGKIVGVSGASLQIQAGSGSFAIPLATVTAVKMAVPADFTAGEQAFEAQEYAKALPPIKAIVDRFKGLPTEWARKATAILGDIYVSLNQLTEAEAAYLSFQKIYGGASSVQTDVGMARIAVSKKEFDKAKEKLDPVATQALKERHPAPAAAAVYSQTFYLLGQVAESQQDFPAALENYLRTVTLFPADKVAVMRSKERADAIRKEHATTVP